MPDSPPAGGTPDLTRELDEAERIVTGEADTPAIIAEHIWKLADEVGNTKLAWRHALSPEERKAFDAVTQRLLRLGGQVGRGEVTDAGPFWERQKQNRSDDGAPR